MSTSINSVINNYTYSYQGSLRPKLDKDDSGVWDRSEFQNYADAYKSATGKELDVDKLFEKYANEDGVIDYKAQQQMIKDDALGLNTLQSMSSSSSTTSTSSSTSALSSKISSSSSTLDKALINALVSNYTFTYKGALQLRVDKMDKDGDGMWSRDDIQNYADALKKATGRAIDVDAIMEKYGNGNGYIDPTGQGKMLKDDAFQLSGLQSDWIKANMSTTATSSKNDSDQNGGVSLSDLLDSMSPAGKAAFSLKMQRNEMWQGLLNSFNSSGIGFSGSSFLDLLNSQSTLQMYSISMRYSSDKSDIYNAMSGQSMNFTI